MPNNQPLMPTDQNLNTMQLSYIDTLRTVTLDGTAAAASSAVIDAEKGTCVLLKPMDGGVGFYKRGINPVAASDDGVYIDSPEHVLLSPGQNISVYGAKVNMSVLRAEQA